MEIQFILPNIVEIYYPEVGPEGHTLFYDTENHEFIRFHKVQDRIEDMLD